MQTRPEVAGSDFMLSSIAPHSQFTEKDPLILKDKEYYANLLRTGFHLSSHTAAFCQETK